MNHHQNITHKEGYQGVGKKEVPVITMDEHELRKHVSEVVRQSVEETLNGLLEAEAGALCAKPGDMSTTGTVQAYNLP